MVRIAARLACLDGAGRAGTTPQLASRACQVAVRVKLWAITAVYHGNGQRHQTFTRRGSICHGFVVELLGTSPRRGLCTAQG